MPTYTVTTPEGCLDDDKRTKIARETTRVLLNERGFVEGNHGEPAQFVVEKAFAER